ncbi:hypothetical protein [Gorillibacterium timonense]|uniref:hypothetical protein n=1 Tax=Gorillibacterium timonense TaxID=1689269 RepID=UPI00071E1728|nr:hypothetical protein [Gorillibacterium timonense]
MTRVLHRNVANDDQEIYCCLRNKVVRADAEHQAQYCNGCKMFSTLLQEGGVECVWEDLRTTRTQVNVTDPYAEWMENQRRDVHITFETVLTDSNEALTG